MILVGPNDSANLADRMDSDDEGWEELCGLSAHDFGTAADDASSPPPEPAPSVCGSSTASTLCRRVRELRDAKTCQELHALNDTLQDLLALLSTRRLFLGPICTDGDGAHDELHACWTEARLPLPAAGEASLVPLLVSLLRRLPATGEAAAAVQHSAAALVAACSGTAASGAGDLTLEFGGGDGNGVTLQPLRLVTPPFVECDVGHKLWPACMVLCRALCNSPELVRQRAVVELGAGIGTAGIVAAVLGAKQVLLTDYSRPLLRVAALNAGKNGVAGSTRADILDWNALQGEAGEGEGQAPAADVVLGADVCYEPAHASLIPQVLAQLLAPGGRALLALQCEHEGFELLLRNVSSDSADCGDSQDSRLQRLQLICPMRKPVRIIETPARNLAAPAHIQLLEFALSDGK